MYLSKLIFFLIPEGYVVFYNSTKAKIKGIQQNLDKFLSKQKKNEKLKSKTRENENLLIQSFSVNKLGIYNLDRIYQFEDAVRFHASFDWGINLPKGYEPDIFLISGEKGKAIIQIKPYEWKDFLYQPTHSNQLIAVMPNNKIAYFSRKKFSALNPDKIKKEGRYIFKMKLANLPESEVDLIKLINE